MCVSYASTRTLLPAVRLGAAPILTAALVLYLACGSVPLCRFSAHSSVLFNLPFQKGAAAQSCSPGQYSLAGVCTPCPPGHTCAGEASAPVPCGSDNLFSAGGAQNCTEVSEGFFSTGGSESTRTGQQRCPAGSFCVGGLLISCDAGTFQPQTGQGTCLDCALECPTGLTKSLDCTPLKDITCSGMRLPVSC